jgi:predicted transcriptional regulator
MTSEPTRPSTIGDQELALLRYVAERDGVSVGEAALEFGRERGLARSTVLTMMERLRRKGHLVRRRRDGVYRYLSPAGADEVLRGAVERFVEKSLGGSFAPFVAYLAERARVSPQELADLEAMVARLAPGGEAPQPGGGEDDRPGSTRPASGRQTPEGGKDR